MVAQCDEARPICSPCQKGRLTCGYEHPAGQTRTQALLEGQHRLRAKLRSHTSMIRTLRHVDSETSIKLLGLLRRGDYDGALLGADSALRVTASGDTVYPWEGSLYGVRTHLDRSTEMLPPLDTLLPAHNGGTVYAILHPMAETPVRSYGQNLGPRASSDVSTAPLASPPGSRSVRQPTKSVRVLGYNQRDPDHQQFD
jgi:hypothetical protein